MSALVGSKVRFATPKEILAKTGYSTGGPPSFGYDARVFIDNNVFQKRIIYGGGGSTNALTKVSPDEIIKANKDIRADLIR